MVNVSRSLHESKQFVELCYIFVNVCHSNRRQSCVSPRANVLLYLNVALNLSLCCVVCLIPNGFVRHAMLYMFRKLSNYNNPLLSRMPLSKRKLGMIANVLSILLHRKRWKDSQQQRAQLCYLLQLMQPLIYVVFEISVRVVCMISVERLHGFQR